MRMLYENDTQAALYLRLSRDDNNGNLESMSISNQRDYLTNYAQERGWKIYDIYIDDGWSGTTFDRPSFKRMIADIEMGYINLVLTKDLSRLGRNYVETGQYTEFFFPQHGVRFLAVNDGVDTANEDNDIAPFKNILNEMYAKDISKKVRSARKVSAQQGKFMGSKTPYGYLKSPEDKHKLVVDPVAAVVIRRIFSEYADGDSGRHIAGMLNAEGIDTPAVYYYKQTGKRATRGDKQQWGSNTVMQLLKNQVYLGHMVQGKRQVASFKTKQRRSVPEDNWIVVENTHEPIVDTDTWNRVQKRIADTRLAPSNHSIRVNSTDSVSLFSGIIRCADCGSAMAFNKKVYRDSEYHIYRCSRYANQGRGQCSTHSISQKTLEQIILSDIRHYAQVAVKDEKTLINKLMSASGRERERERSAKRQAMSKLRNRMAAIDKMVKQLFEEKVAGSMSEPMFRKMLTDYEREQNELDRQIQALDEDIQADIDTERDVLMWMGLIKDCLSMQSLDRETAYRLIDSISVSEKIKVNGKRQQNVSIQYNFVGCLDQ